MLTIPIYSVTTKAKGRVEYQISSVIYEYTEIPANSLIALLDGTVYASRTATLCANAFNRCLYWTSASALAIANTAAYGTYQTVTASAASSGVLTINSPAFGIRGSTTYFTSTYFNKLTDIRYQYVIKVYRVPKENYNYNGWGGLHNSMHIINCANSSGHTLT